MNAIRLLTAIALMCAVLSAAPPVADRAEYASGTVNAVPLGTKGTLDFTGGELKFNYPGSVYTIPFDRLSGVEQGRHTGVAGKLKKVSSVLTRSKTDHLTVTFKDEKNTVHMMTFATTRQQVAKALPVLQAKVAKPAPTPQSASAAPAGVSEQWWGDKYWKTNRNMNKWPTPAKTAEQAPR